MSSQPDYQLFVCPSCVLSDLTLHQSAFVCPQPIWELGGSVQLLVVVFCPSVLLTGPSIWAAGHIINQMVDLFYRNRFGDGHCWRSLLGCVIFRILIGMLTARLGLCIGLTTWCRVIFLPF